jgi:peptide deformylase
MVKIVQKENKVLREKAKKVPVDEIKSPKIQKVIEDMKKALATQEDGVAIAAPQIGVSLQIFVVSGRALAILKGKEEKDALPDLVFINPKIIKLSQEKELMEEGCLSVRWFYGKVKRSKKAFIEACNEKGNFVKKGASGILAQVFQHEIDHLNGVLFIDKAEDLEEIPPEEVSKRNP